jgi:hypothetical protein
MRIISWSRVKLETFFKDRPDVVLQLGDSLGADLTRLLKSAWNRRIRIWVRGVAIQTPVNEPKREEEVMKADALMRFILSGNRSLEEFAVLLARISLGVFLAFSGGNKLFVASQYKIMYETISLSE